MSVPSWYEKYVAKLFNEGWTSTKQAPPPRDEVAEEAARIRAEWDKRKPGVIVEISYADLEPAKAQAAAQYNAAFQAQLQNAQIQQAQAQMTALAQAQMQQAQIMAAGYGTGTLGGFPYPSATSSYITATSTNFGGIYPPFFSVPPIRPDASFMNLYEAELERARYMRDVEET